MISKKIPIQSIYPQTALNQEQQQQLAATIAELINGFAPEPENNNGKQGD